MVRSNRHRAIDRSIETQLREKRDEERPDVADEIARLKARKPQRRGRAVSPHFGIPSSNKLYRAGSQCCRESLPESSRLFFLFFSRDPATPFFDLFGTSVSAQISRYISVKSTLSKHFRWNGNFNVMREFRFYVRKYLYVGIFGYLRIFYRNCFLF